MFCRYKESCLSVLTIPPLFTQRDRREGWDLRRLHSYALICAHRYSYSVITVCYQTERTVSGLHTLIYRCSVRLKIPFYQRVKPDKKMSVCVWMSFYGCGWSVSVCVSQWLQVMQVVEGLGGNREQLVVLKHPINKQIAGRKKYQQRNKTCL